MSEPLSTRNGFTVGAFNPFWRYAVAPYARPDLPGIPYFTKGAALACLDQMLAAVPQTKPVLLRRRLFGRVEIVSPS